MARIKIQTDGMLSCSTTRPEAIHRTIAASNPREPKPVLSRSEAPSFTAGAGITVTVGTPIMVGDPPTPVLMELVVGGTG
jgi:hypothetical protein